MATTSNSSLPKPVFLPKSQRHNLPNAPLSYSSPSLPHPPPPPPAAAAASDDGRERDLAAIRSHYLGPTNPKKRRLTASAHGRFNFSWSGTDDTSDPALALGPTADFFHPLFGRGLIAGMDRPLQKNSSKSRPHPSDSGSNGPLKPLHKMTERDFRILLEDLDISIRGCRTRRLFRIWPESGLSPKLLEAVSSAGYEEPSPIQMVAIPFGLDRRDLIGIARTGSGKTAAFVLPMLHHISSIPPEPDSDPNAEPQGPHGVVLAPTRELALQIEAAAKKFARGLDVKVMSIVGGQSIEQQGFSVYRGCDVVIATPGRLLDCLERRYIALNRCHYVVLDEADRMIDMGFEDQVVKVLDAMPSSNLRAGENEVYRTTMMFSATMPRAAEKLAKKYLREPVTITVGLPGQVTDLVTQQVIMMKENEKMGRLERILDDIGDRTAIVFVNTKKSVDVLAKNLGRAGYRAITFHGGMGQKQREKSLESFKDRKFNVLVATDVAGRGIDIPGVSHVINYDMPNDIKKYTHRIGRTGRTGKTGTAITFLTMYDTDVFYDLKHLLVESRSPVPQELARHEASKFKPGTVRDRPHREQ